MFRAWHGRGALAAAGCTSAAALSLSSAPLNSSSSATDSIPPRPGLKLLQVQVAFRHGARTPLYSLSDDVRWSRAEYALPKAGLCELECYRPCSTEPLHPAHLFVAALLKEYDTIDGALPGGALPGILTTTGRGQAIELGATLRARYIGESDGKLLPDTWERARRLVTLRSTEFQRTVYTAQAVLSGLFPTEAAAGTMRAELSLNTAGDWVDEFLSFNEAGCARLAQLFESSFHAVQSKLSAEELALIRRVEEAPSEPGMSAWQIAAPAAYKLLAYNEQLMCRSAAGKRVPAHIAEVAEDLSAAAAQQQHRIMEGGSEELRIEALRLGIGRLLAFITERLERPDGSLHLLSGHDWTVMPLLLCLARRGEPLLAKWPPFCSHISFELWTERFQDGHSHWACMGDQAAAEGRLVRVLFNGEVVQMECSDVDGLCRLKDFRKMVSKYCHDLDFQGECRRRSAKKR